MDVKSTFLNGVLKEEVYIEQPLGYKVKGEEDKVLKLKKALYGLKLKNKIRSKLLITKPDYRWSREKCKFFLVSIEFKTKKKCDEIMRNCNSFLLHEVIFSLLV